MTIKYPEISSLYLVRKEKPPSGGFLIFVSLLHCMLSKSQLQNFQENGYLVLEKLFSKSECDQLIKRAGYWVNKLSSEKQKSVFSTTNQESNTNDYFLDSGDKIRIFMEENDPEIANKLGHALHDLDDTFNAFSRQKIIKEIANAIGFVDPLLIQSMFIFKESKSGGEVQVHQDSCFLYTQPLSVIGFWVSLEETTTENGCLWALPGGHNQALRRQFVRGKEGSCYFEELDRNAFPMEDFIPLEVPEGSLILLHGSLPHYSQPNLSQKSRNAYALHIIEGNSSYSNGNWLQRSKDFPAQDFS